MTCSTRRASAPPSRHKPYFDWVNNRLGPQAERPLFFDDREEIVKAATASMAGRRCRSTNSRMSPGIHGLRSDCVSDYVLVERTPTVTEYRELRRLVGLSAKTEAAAVAGLPNTRFAVVLEREGVAIGMGRVIGDGGTAFQLTDIAVLPEHQKRGAGQAHRRGAGGVAEGQRAAIGLCQPDRRRTGEGPLRPVRVCRDDAGNRSACTCGSSSRALPHLCTTCLTGAPLRWSRPRSVARESGRPRDIKGKR